jgi:5-methylcytosine-specific restriction endonuclease McrA
MDILSFDPEKRYLGKLCKYGHDYCGTGKSLRYKYSRDCVECSKALKRKLYAENPEIKQRILEHNKTPQAKERMRQYHKTSPKAKEYARKYSKTPQRQEYLRQLRQTEEYKELSRHWCRQRLARKRANHYEPYTVKQVKELKASFNYSCAYCGVSSQELHLDHVIALSRGGADAINNLVPACPWCNDSKYNSPVEDWYRKQPFFSEDRWLKIQGILSPTD